MSLHARVEASGPKVLTAAGSGVTPADETPPSLHTSLFSSVLSVVFSPICTSDSASLISPFKNERKKREQRQEQFLKTCGSSSHRADVALSLSFLSSFVSGACKHIK